MKTNSLRLLLVMRSSTLVLHNQVLEDRYTAEDPGPGDDGGEQQQEPVELGPAVE